MHGHIDIVSARGKGTTFTLNIPLALSLLDGMILNPGSERWSLPLHMVVEAFRMASSCICHVVGVGDVMSLRGDTILLMELCKCLEVPRREA